MSRTIFIYGLKDPRDGKIKYVGQTANMTARMASHFSTASPGKSKKAKWVEELNREGLAAEPMVLEMCDEDSASDRETFWIEEMSKGAELFNYYAHKSKQRRRKEDGKSGLALRVTPEERAIIYSAARVCGVSMGELAARSAVEIASRVEAGAFPAFNLRFIPILFASKE
jgi:hypothetical protein